MSDAPKIEIFFLARAQGYVCVDNASNEKFSSDFRLQYLPNKFSASVQNCWGGSGGGEKVGPPASAKRLDGLSPSAKRL